MENKFTPYEFSILLHYYTRPTDWECMSAPIWRGTMDNFIKLGLIEEAHGIDNRATYAVTSKCIVYLEAALSTNLPIQKWIVE